MSSAISLLGYLFNQISIGDIDEVEKVLHQLPLNSLSSEDYLSLASRCMFTAVSYNELSILRLIYEVFSESNYDDKIPFRIQLCMSRLISDDVIYALSIAVDDLFTTGNLLNDFLLYEASDEATVGCFRVIKLLGSLSFDEYRELLDRGRAQENETIITVANSELTKISPNAPIPGWVNNQYDEIPNEDDLPLPEQPELPSMNEVDAVNIESAISLLTSSSDIIGEDKEKMAETLRMTIPQMTKEEKYNLLLPLFARERAIEMQQNKELFRLLGPVNAQPTMPFMDSDFICERYGGCRMFLCGCIDRFTEDNQQENEDWFTGYCLTCNKQISNVCHCIRRPVTLGGWTGVYCSIPCLKDDLEEPNLLLAPLIAVVENQLKMYGIQDRV